MTHGCRATALILLTTVSVACSEASGSGSITVVDSAGVQIVTNVPGSIETAESWSLAEIPLTDIGSGVDPDVPLFRVAAVTPLSDGRVAISTSTPPRVVIVGPDGNPSATLGRRGEGPGEFLGVGSVVALGSDSLAVWDPDRRRMSVFTSDGRFQREVDLSGVAPLSWMAAPSTSVLSARTQLMNSAPGSLVLFSVGVFGPSPIVGVRRLEAPSYRITTGGKELADLGRFPGEATYWSDQIGGGPFPLGPNTHAATSRGALVVGTAEGPEYRRYSPTGDVEQIVRWPDHDRDVGGPLLASWNDFWAASLDPLPQAERDARNEILEAMSQPERFPAYGSLVGSDTGEIWVGSYYPAQLGLVVMYMGRLRIQEQRWLVFDADGAVVATIQTPVGFQLHAVRDGIAWGVHADELDVESVQAYEIVGRRDSGF